MYLAGSGVKQVALCLGAALTDTRLPDHVYQGLSELEVLKRTPAGPGASGSFSTRQHRQSAT